MNAADVWAVIVLVGVGTFLIRVSFFVLFEYLETIPAGVERALWFVPAAVLAALAAPAVVVVDGSPAVSFANGRLLAAGLAVVVAWRTESVLATIVAGMATLVGLGFVL